jgi:hypothetical protein
MLRQGAKPAVVPLTRHEADRRPVGRQAPPSYHRAIADLYSPDPAERQEAARGLGRLARRSLRRRAEGWPDHSPGAINAWLLLVTTKPPTWRDPLVLWPADAPALGEPHHGFFYPDPLGFWAEVRRWATVLVGAGRPGSSTADALAVTSLLHVGDDQRRLAWGQVVMRPRVVLFLDDPSWQAAGMVVSRRHHQVPDPHRPHQAYEGFWGTADDGTVVGKSPQHPAMHNLYRAGDMEAFLASVPL